MAIATRALVLEHDQTRFERLARTLARDDRGVELVRVDRLRELVVGALSDVDLVIAREGSDASDCLAALEALARAGVAVPLIALVDAGDDVKAAAARAAGAADVVRADDLEPLARSVARALEHAHAERALLRAELELARYRSFFADGPVIVFRWRACAGWPVEYVSPNVAQLFGVDAEALMSGRVTYAELVHPDDLARVADEVAAHTERGVAGFDQEYRVVRPGGDVRWLFDHTLVTRDESGSVTYYEGYVIDITEHKTEQISRERMERQLVQTQRLESLGVLAGGIAHDFNNLLTGVLGNAGLALKDMDRTHASRAAIVQVVQIAERAADLTRQILAYAGRCSFEKRAVDVSTLVREIAQLLSSSLPKKVKLTLDLCADLPAVEADPAQLQQIVMNLVINAAEAYGDRAGSAAVSTSCVTVEEAAAGAELAPGTWVVIEVRDEGCGMDEATRARIFDPFFTTKFHGRGLGLSAVLGILRAHGGQMRVSSAPGEGSTFRAWLPASTQPVPEHADAPAVDLSGHGLILVIDDEPSVLQVASRILRAHGYEVLTARDGRQGAEIFRARRDEIDLVLLDQTMPEMGGEETLEALRAARDDVAVIVSSGYDETEIRTRFRGRPPASFLQKPYSVEALAAAVKRVLERNHRVQC